MKIFFFTAKAQKRFGSESIKGIQVCNYLKKYFDCECTRDLSKTNNSIVIFIKDTRVNYDILKNSKNNNNINIIDVIDYRKKNNNIIDFYENKFIDYIDGFIMSNIFSKNEFDIKYKNKFTYVIPHHYDVRMNDFSCKKDEHIKILFNGDSSINNCLHLDKLRLRDDFLINDSCNSFEEFLNNDMYKKCLCHINIRDENSFGFKYKPCMKLAHAVASDSIIITTYDMSIRDILPNDYPYILINHEYDTVINMIDYVKKTYNTDVWFKALNILNELKEKLNIEYIVKNYYCDFINKIILTVKMND
jgi:hypothetical protein